MTTKPRPPLPPKELSSDDFPGDRPGLEAALAALEREEGEWSAYIKTLSALEDQAAGVYHAAPLHEARQYRMVIRYRKDFCKARLRRLSG